MKTIQFLFLSMLTAYMVLIGATAGATPVTLNYNGTASSYLFEQGGLSSFIPLGTSMNLSLTYNETYSDGTYDFSDDLGPVTGTLNVGNFTYTLNSYTTGWAAGYPNNIVWVQTQFLGSGPAPLGADFFGLFITVTPSLTLYSEPSLGFGWDWANGGGTSYGYVNFTGTGIFTRVNVPEPASIALLGVGLAGLLASRRRQR